MFLIVLIAGYDPSFLRRFLTFFPNDALASGIRACLLFLGLALEEPEEDTEELLPLEQVNIEDIFALALVRPIA